jgi:predicted ATPase
VLKRLYVDNIRCLTNFEFVPKKVAALVGPNGGGKSSVYRVMGALSGFLQGGLADQVFPRNSITRWDTRLKQVLVLHAEGPNGDQYAYTLNLKHLKDGRTVRIDEERLEVNGGLVYRFVGGEVQLFGDDASATPRTTFPFSPTRSFLPLLESRPDNQLIMGFKDWVSRIWLFSPQPQLIRPVSENEERVINSNADNFVSWFRMLTQEQPLVHEALRADLASVVPGLVQVKLTSTGPAKYINVDCRIAGSPISLELGELSDGQRALMVLYAIKYAIAPRASILFFDEPDNYLAQSEIKPWLGSLRESMEGSGGTLLVISHHPDVIDYLAPDQVLRLRRTEEGPTRIEVVDFSEARANGITASEMLRLEAP